MAYFAKEEYVPRHGVLMKVVDLPRPNVALGEHRDVRVTAAAQQFEHGTFVLNKALDARPAPVSKVRTFPLGAVHAATGNGNVIAPTPLPWHAVHRRHAPTDEELAKTYRTAEQQAARQQQQELMARAHGGFDLMTQPKAERRHRLPPVPMSPEKSAVLSRKQDIMGFHGLGLTAEERHGGKALVPAAVQYDPLGFRRYQAPERVAGLKRHPEMSVDHIATVVQHDDGVPLLLEVGKWRTHAASPKRSPTHESSTPHRSYSSLAVGGERGSVDIPGFPQMAASDEPRRPSMVKQVLTPIDHHYGPAPVASKAGAPKPLMPHELVPGAAGRPTAFTPTF